MRKFALPCISLGLFLFAVILNLSLAFDLTSIGYIRLMVTGIAFLLIGVAALIVIQAPHGNTPAPRRSTSEKD